MWRGLIVPTTAVVIVVVAPVGVHCCQGPGDVLGFTEAGAASDAAGASYLDAFASFRDEVGSRACGCTAWDFPHHSIQLYLAFTLLYKE